MEKNDNCVRSSQLSSVHFFGFIKGYEISTPFYERWLMPITLIIGCKKPPVLQLLKKFDAAEGALV
jgi:hypothetical protein